MRTEKEPDCTMTTGITHIFNLNDTPRDREPVVLLRDRERGITCEMIADGSQTFGAGSQYFAVQSGTITLTAPGEDSFTVGAGQACMLPAASGWSLTASSGISALRFGFAGDNGTGRPVLLDPAIPPAMEVCAPTPASLLVSGHPEQHDIVLANAANGQMNVGAWSTTAYARKSIPFPKHEVMYLLDGNLVLTEQDGTRHAFGTNDVFLVRKNTVFDWRTDGLTKFYLTFTLKDG